jgi:hypothetical protein
MRVPEVVSEFFEWRWAPCVGLTAGSLAFVALSLLLIPTQFGSAKVPTAEAQRSFDRPGAPLPRALYGASLARGLPVLGQHEGEAEQAPPPAPLRPVANIAAEAPPPARGFSPVAERPEPLAPPPVIEALPAPPSVPMPSAAPDLGGPAPQ